MNIEKLIEQLSSVFPTETRSSLLPHFQALKKILSDNAQDPELAVNKAEEFLIGKINSDENSRHQKLYRLALKMVLLSRGYFSDELGGIERSLLLFPINSVSFNNLNKKPISPNEAVPRWLYINEIRFMISSLVDKQRSPGDRMEDTIQSLMTLIKEELNKLVRNGHNPYGLVEDSEEAASKEMHQFKLNYLNRCLNTLRNYRVLKTSLEHSVWASASHQAVEDLALVSTEEFRQKIGGNSTRQEEQQSAFTEMHKRRIEYYSNQAKELLEPLGFAAEDALQKASPQRKKPIFSRSRKTSHRSLDEMQTAYQKDSVATQERRRLDNETFSKAVELILKHPQEPYKIAEVFNLATRLIENKNALGHFIHICALTLVSPPSEERWKSHFSSLEEIVIPAHYRGQVAQLWFCLSDYFLSKADSANPKYKSFATNCLKEVNERFEEACSKMASLKLAKITGDKKQIEFQEGELQSCHEATTNSVNAALKAYPKEAQWLLCQARTQALSGDQYAVLIQDHYPYGLEHIIKTLFNDSATEHSALLSAVEKVYGNIPCDPLSLCELMKKHPFNRRVMLWGPIYISSLEKGLLKEKTYAWIKQGLSKDDIQRKLLAQTRNNIYRVLNDDETLIPGAQDFLVELDKKILESTLKLIESIQKDPNSHDFSFCKDKPGLIYAVWAEIALQEENWFVAEQLAQLAAIRATPDEPLPSSPKHSTVEKTRSTRTSSLGDVPENQQQRKARSLTRGSFASLRYANTPTNGNGKRNPPPLTRTFSSGDQIHNAKTTAAPLLKQADSTPSSPHYSPNNSPEKPIYSPVAQLDLTTKPLRRSLSGANKQNTPSRLCYLILAQIVWYKSLAGKKERDEKDIELFKEHLENAKGASDPGERWYIKAMLWWHHYDSRFDPIWLNVEDQSIYKASYENMRSERWRSLGTEERRQGYAVYKIARKYFLRALKGDEDLCESFSMFPPAAFSYEKRLWYLLTDFEDGTPLRTNATLELASLLKKCIDDMGYPFAAFPYSSLLRNNLDLFRQEGSLATMYEYIKKYFDASEKFIDIDHGIKVGFYRKVREVSIQERGFYEEIEEKEEVVSRFGRAINIQDYPKRDSILKSIEEEFDKNESETLQSRLLNRLEDEWCDEDLLLWFSTKMGIKNDSKNPKSHYSLQQLLQRLSLIIINEFKDKDSTLRTRILTKLKTELSSIRLTLIQQMTRKRAKGELPNAFYVAQLMPVSPQFKESAKSFLEQPRFCYTPKKPKQVTCTVKALPPKLYYADSPFDLFSPSNRDREKPFSLTLSCSAKSDPDLFLELQHHFKQAEKFFLYYNKLSFSEPVLLLEESQFIINHLDIAILGIMRILKTYTTTNKIKLDNPQALSLINFLREAQNLEATLWQSPRTVNQLKSFIHSYDTQRFNTRSRQDSEAPLYSPTALDSPSNSARGSRLSERRESSRRTGSTSARKNLTGALYDEGPTSISSSPVTPNDILGRSEGSLPLLSRIKK